MRYAFRTLLKSPGFSATAILTLALGIGANTAIFSVVDGILLQPLPYPTSDRLVNLWETKTAGEAREISISVENYTDWRERNRVFEHLAARNSSRTTLTGGAQAESIEGSNITGNLFDVLGARLQLGRGFTAEEERVGGPPAVILTWRFFERWFQADPAALGRSITLDGVAFTVVGVTPPGFRYPLYHERGDYFLPLLRQKPEGRGSHPGISGVGLLKPGMTLAAARADMHRIARELTAEYPATNSSTGIGLAMLKDRLTGDVGTTLWILLGAVGFVLVIGCANVAHLHLARAAGRRQELSVRVALGASQRDLIKQLLGESLVLASAAGALAMLIAYASTKGLLVLLPATTPRLNEVSLNLRALAFAVAVSVFTGIAVGIAPALDAARRSIADTIREAGQRAGDSRSRQRGRRLMIVAEVALSLVLLTGAGLLIESFGKLIHTSPGFTAERVIATDFTLPRQGYASPERQAAFFAELLERARALRGVEAAAIANGMLGGWQQRLEVEGVPSDPNVAIPTDMAVVSPDYFRLMGIPVKRGRVFDESDRAGGRPVSVIDETLAARFFPNQNPIGRRIRAGGSEWTEIVGVVGHVKNYGVDQPSRFETYLAVAQDARPFGSLVLRISENRPGVIAALREEVKRMDAGLPVRRILDVADSVAEGRATRRVATTLISVFAGLALLLASIGLYGVISYSVAQRTREMGVRMALGAHRRDILSLILNQGARLTALGVVAGLAASLALTRYLQNLLFEVSPFDLRIFFSMAALLGAIAILAALIPAWRATRVDPMIALRQD